MDAGRWRERAPWMAVGLLAGLGLAGFWPQAPLHAVATDHQEGFAVCTGFVDEDIEALYFLDFLTGNLQASILSIQTGQFNSYYERNILQDLEIDPSKSPRYMMVTGVANLRRGPARVRPGAAVVYVAEATSGKIAAYAIPWIGGQQAANARIQDALVLLSVTQFRTTAVRDE